MGATSRARRAVGVAIGVRPRRQRADPLVALAVHRGSEDVDGTTPGTPTAGRAACARTGGLVGDDGNDSRAVVAAVGSQPFVRDSRGDALVGCLLRGCGGVG